jgi:hypothetical protein
VKTAKERRDPRAASEVDGKRCYCLSTLGGNMMSESNEFVAWSGSGSHEDKLVALVPVSRWATG